MQLELVRRPPTLRTDRQRVIVPGQRTSSGFGGGLTLVVITHDESVAARAARRVRIIDGQLVEVEPVAAGTVSEQP